MTSGPDSRDQLAVLVRWNHYFDGLKAALRTSYRYYHDDWEINAHTGTMEWAQELPHGFTLTPSLRYTTQSAAFFYYDPVYDAALGAPFPPGYCAQSQRLLHQLTSDSRHSAAFRRA